MSNITPIENYNAFPSLRTENIVIGAESIDVTCVINTNSGNSLNPEWFLAGEFSRFVKFYFYVLGINPFLHTAAGRLQYPRDRCHPRPGERDLYDKDSLQWNGARVEISLSEILQENESLLSVEREVSDVRFSFTIPLKIISEFQYKFTGSRNEPSYFKVPNDNGRQLIYAFEPAASKIVLVGFSHIDLSELRDEFDIDTSDHQSSLFEIGGNMTYDTLLDKSSGTWVVPETIQSLIYSQSGNYKGIPYVAGTPYVGPAVYYDEQDRKYFPDNNLEQPAAGNQRRFGANANLGPGYIGWVAGDSKVVDPNVPLLDSRTVRSYKISSPGRLQDEYFISDYYGANSLYDTEAYENTDLARDTPLLARGVDTDRFSRSFQQLFSADTYDLESSLSPEFYTMALDTLRKNHFDRKIKNNVSEFIVDKETWIRSDDSGELQEIDLTDLDVGRTDLIGGGFHAVIFGVDYKRIIKMNSKYGYLLDNMSESQCKEVVEMSDLEDISIYRRRLSNFATGNNVLGSNNYFEYGINTFDKQIDEYLISSRDDLDANNPQRDDRNYRMNLLQVEYEKASLREVEIQYPDYDPNLNGRYIRSFYLKDIDLYDNINYGTYTYIICYKIKDGIKRYLQNKLNNLYSQLDRLGRFLTEASKPYFVDSQDRFYGAGLWQADLFGIPVMDADPENDPHAGNYDYKNDKFASDRIGSLNQEYGEVLRDVVNSYVECSDMFRPRGTSSNPDRRRNADVQREARRNRQTTIIRHAIIPGEHGESAKIAHITEFYENYLKLVRVYEQLLDRQKFEVPVSALREGQLSSSRTQPLDFNFCKNSLTGGLGRNGDITSLDKHIVVESDLGMSIEAVRPGDVLVNYIPDNLVVNATDAVLDIILDQQAQARAIESWISYWENAGLRARDLEIPIMTPERYWDPEPEPRAESSWGYYDPNKNNRTSPIPDREAAGLYLTPANTRNKGEQSEKDKMYASRRSSGGRTYLTPATTQQKGRASAKDIAYAERQRNAEALLISSLSGGLMQQQSGEVIGASYSPSQISQIATALSAATVQPDGYRINISAGTSVGVSKRPDKDATDSFRKGVELEIIVGQGSQRAQDGGPQGHVGFSMDDLTSVSISPGTSLGAAGLSMGIVGSGVHHSPTGWGDSYVPNSNDWIQEPPDMQWTFNISTELEKALCAAAGIRNIDVILQMEMIATQAENEQVARSLSENYYMRMDLIRAAARQARLGPGESIWNTGQDLGVDSQSGTAVILAQENLISKSPSLNIKNHIKSANNFTMQSFAQDYYSSRSAVLATKTIPSEISSPGQDLMPLQAGTQVSLEPQSGQALMLVKVAHTPQSSFAGQGSVRPSNDVGFAVTQRRQGAQRAVMQAEGSQMGAGGYGR